MAGDGKPAKDWPFRLGLTGSVGMGKSTTAAMFADQGVPVYDADAAVHDLYAGAVVAPISQLFPRAVVDGRVDRDILREIIAQDPTALQRLEKVVHPLVRAREKQFIETAADNGEKLVVLDIPLLFETGAEGRVDAVLVVTAPASVQRQRVMARPGMNEDLFGKILARQLPDREKRSRATYLIDTSQGLDAARRQVQNLISELAGSSSSSSTQEAPDA